MEIPLTLQSSRPDRLVYGLPVGYRAAMALLLAALAAGLGLAGRPPGALGWTLLVLVALGGLYEERWSFDAGRGQVRRRVGLLFAARTRELEFEAIVGFRLGRQPAGGRVYLFLECGDGSRLLLDAGPGRRLGPLRELGRRLADLCGKPLAED